MDVESAEVKAAGCVVWRRAGEELELALIHRPRYDDWSLPKGKLDPGETWEQAAVREVEEEISRSGALGTELEPIRYADHRGRDKVVRYWLMQDTGEDAAFVPNDEVDERWWAPPAAARARLTYESDRIVLDRALAALTA